MTKEEIQELGNAIIKLVNQAYAGDSAVETSWHNEKELHATLHKIFGDKGETK